MRMGRVRTKLLYLFDRRDTEELTRLVRFLVDEPDDAAPDLRQLALGYLAEIEGRPTDALGHYQQVVDRAAGSMGEEADAQENPRLEDALRRMSFLALQRGEAETAISVLDVLAALSPAYEPQYADALRLAGRLEDAVQVYTGYLERVPGDLVTMLKLGRLFHDAGIAESARWAYDYVLAKDPRNSDARQLRDQLPG
jgi:tetratricopeptide (TPR) repeat protein